MISYGSVRPGSYTVTYPQVRVHTERKGCCPVCQRRVRRNTTFTAIMSPLNKAPDGHVRTRVEIQEVLREQARAWEPDFTHERCRTAA